MRGAAKRELTDSEVREMKALGKLNGQTGQRVLVVWSPEECEGLKDLVARLDRLHNRGMAD